MREMQTPGTVCYAGLPSAGVTMRLSKQEQRNREQFAVHQGSELRGNRIWFRCVTYMDAQIVTLKI